jgi:hypothetical protein
MATALPSPDKAEFTYQTQLVIYKFLSLVPSSVQTTPSDDELSSLSSHGMPNGLGDGVPGQQMGNEAGRRRDIDEEMFTELKDAVAARQHQKDEAARTKLLSKRVFKELKAKVDEREKYHHEIVQGDFAVAPLTIIRKKNVVKAVMSPPIGMLAAHVGVSGGREIHESPLMSSTPSITSSSHTISSIHPLSDQSDLSESTDQLSRSVSCVSDAGSAYFDIYEFHDIKPLVNAGVLPPVVEPLLEEVQHGLEELNTSYFSKHAFCCFFFLTTSSL